MVGAMNRRALAAFLLLAACQPALPPPQTADLRAALVTEPQPAVAPDGACWGSDIVPAVIETVTVQDLVTPEDRADDGTLVTAAVFRTRTEQRMIGDRAEVWFRVPCATDLTVPYIATLQRALKARGFYDAAVTGAYDAPTAAAVQRYQAGRGFDSDRLTLAAAQALGVAVTPVE
jgi:hypothetical protein